MKLLHCPYCNDIFKLLRDPRSCDCGKTVGKYKADGSHAVTNGEGVHVAVNNREFLAAFFDLQSCQHSVDPTYEDCRDQFSFEAWLRPNDGKANPRSEVDPDLKSGVCRTAEQD
jgi:hypothetical protein